MDAKTCFRCSEEKPLGAFYAHPKMADGLLGKCKECTKKDTKNHRDQNLQHCQAYERWRKDLPHRIEARKKYASSSTGRKANRISKDEWATRNPEKVAASRAVSEAVRSGRLIRSHKCAVCGSTKNVEAHHENYSEPLKIIELCKIHHWEADRNLRPATKNYCKII